MQDPDGFLPMTPQFQVLVVALVAGFPLAIAAAEVGLQWRQGRTGVLELAHHFFIETLSIGAASLPVLVPVVLAKLAIRSVADHASATSADAVLGFIAFIPALVEAKLLFRTIVVVACWGSEPLYTPYRKRRRR